MSKIIKILLVIGGINWGLVGLSYFFASEESNWNFLNAILGSRGTTYEPIEAGIYILIGVATLLFIFTKSSSSSCDMPCCTGVCSSGCKDCKCNKGGKCECDCEGGKCSA